MSRYRNKYQNNDYGDYVNERSDRSTNSYHKSHRSDNSSDENYQRRDRNYGSNNYRRNGSNYKKPIHTYKQEIQQENDASSAEITEELENLSPEEEARRKELKSNVESFENMDLDDKILRGIFSYGFEQPSPIQQVAIRPLCAGYDIIGQAQSGFGKTATFCIGALNRTDITLNKTQILIISHTMELASQIWVVMSCLNKYYNARLNLSIKSLSPIQNVNELLGKTVSNGEKTIESSSNPNEEESWGGRVIKQSNTRYRDSNIEENKEYLIPQIVIGTPGRLIDMIKQGALNLVNLKSLILDEADELLSDGFVDQIKTIISNMSCDTQIALFSATMNANFFKLTRKFMNNPINILVKNDELTLEGIRQYYVNVLNNKYKYDTLCDIYSFLTVSQTIIFCNSQKTVEYLANKMKANNFTVSCIHGELSVIDREKTMSEFRRGASRVLIATDMIGRGIDIQQVSIVINYELPKSIHQYIHRIGRSGRYGRKGVSINFITEDQSDIAKLKEIESFYSTQISELPSNLEVLVIN